MKNKLWQKSYDLNQDIEQFTVGDDRKMDLYLAPYDVLGSLAHIRMLSKVGLLEEEERQALAKSLSQIYQRAIDGDFAIEDGIEDVHSQVEMLLTQELGDVGKKIHSGRSRNDQVLVDLRLFFRAEIETLSQSTLQLFETLQSLSEEHKDILMPGYTHLQVAMVSSFGLWFGAYAESLVDDMQQLLATYKIMNHNPLGSAAGYGSSFPLDRKLTTELLGFEDLNYNVVHAQMGRGKTELFLAFALAAIGHTLNKLAMDIVLFMNQNFGFIRFPDELTTGSSIMPHKKNPDVFELIRAKCNQLIALPGQVSMLTTNLPSGYHRDFQLLKEGLFPALQLANESLAMATFALQNIKVNKEVLDTHPMYKYLFSVEVVNREVLSGTPFRDAYQKIGEDIDSGNFDPDREVHHTHEGSIGNLCTAEIKAKMDRVVEAFPFTKVEEKINALLQG
ncbi:MAG TPA: argininosuccinate lyase [Saprospiraceae bacterium]|nr:argininosuccinate lyase [Saprospiraceae bacterium]